MIDLEVIRCTVMHCNQVFQAFLHCLCIHRTPAGKLHTVTKCDLYSCIIHKFIISCKPWLYFHVVIIFEQSFANAITKCTPA